MGVERGNMAKKSQACLLAMRSSAARISGNITNMTMLAAGVSVFGAAILAKLPHGYNTLAEGQGKPPSTNRRVQVIAAVLLYCLVINKNLAVRVWAIPLAALLTLAVTQHNITYNSENVTDLGLLESY